MELRERNGKLIAILRLVVVLLEACEVLPVRRRVPEGLPHSALRGQTPDEMYLGGADRVPEELEAQRKDARAHRLAADRARTCRVCQVCQVCQETGAG